MRIMSPYTLKWLPGGRERNDISMLIRERYSQVYPATLSACMSCLPGLYDSRGELKAAGGIRIAPQGAFYLEHYLDEPVETLLSSLMAGELAGGHLTLSQTSLLLNLFSHLPDTPWTVATGESYVPGLA